MQHIDKKPRILVLTSTFPRWNDDSEPRFVLDLCRYLLDYAEVQVLAPHAPGAAMAETIENVPVRRFRYFITLWQGITNRGGITARIREEPWRVIQVPFLFVALWWQAVRVVRAWKPDVIHAHWIIPQGLVACLASRGRIPVLCTSHGGDLHGLRSYVFQRLKSWTLNHCRAITVVSRGMVEQVKILAPERLVKVIPMGTDLNTLFIPPKDPATRRDNELLFVGRLVQGKGLHDLLEAFGILKQVRDDLKLTIVGDGPMMQQIQYLASQLGVEQDVHLPGSVRHAQLPAYYQRATLAVFPFKQEGFGLVITEAMGCGCPVIASDIPAVSDTIESGISGIITPPGEPVSLANTIRNCLDDTPLRSRVAMSALETVRNQFGWPSIARRYFHMIEDCAESEAMKGPDRARS